MVNIKDLLETLGWIAVMILGILVLFGIFIGIKILYAWIAEQFGIPYIWVL